MSIWVLACLNSVQWHSQSHFQIVLTMFELWLFGVRSPALSLTVSSPAFQGQNQLYVTKILQAIVWFTLIFRLGYSCLFFPNLNICVLLICVSPWWPVKIDKTALAEAAMSYLVILLIGWNFLCLSLGLISSCLVVLFWLTSSGMMVLLGYSNTNEPRSTT